MKQPLRHFILNAVGIAILAYFIPAVSYNQNLRTLLFAAFVLSLANLIVKPILKIILLPINLLTFGLAGWLIQVIILYLTVMLVDGFTIGNFTIGPSTIAGISLPAIHFSGFWAYLGVALMLSLIGSVLYWVL